MPLDEGLLALLGDQLEGVHPEPVHLPVVGRDALIGQQPRQLQPTTTAASRQILEIHMSESPPLSQLCSFHVTCNYL